MFFNTNITTGIQVAEARGVILCVLEKNNINISEYTPLQVKQALVGYGRADKSQIKNMVKDFLKLEKMPKLDDTTDALAIAICHANSNKYNEYLKEQNNIKDLEELKHDSDKEMAELAKMELEVAVENLAKIEDELQLLLAPKDPLDDRNVIVEIRGAAGGDEGNIFAGDLFRMYTRYAESHGFSYQVYNSVDGTAGGFSQIEL